MKINCKLGLRPEPVYRKEKENPKEF